MYNLLSAFTVKFRDWKNVIPLSWVPLALKPASAPYSLSVNRHCPHLPPTFWRGGAPDLVLLFFGEPPFPIARLGPPPERNDKLTLCLKYKIRMVLIQAKSIHWRISLQAPGSDVDPVLDWDSLERSSAVARQSVDADGEARKALLVHILNASSSFFFLVHFKSMTLFKRYEA